MGKHVHKLLEKYPEERRGVCAACGPCGLVSHGNGQFLCNRLPGPGRTSTVARGAATGPVHRVSDVLPSEGTSGTATCSVCGPNALVRKKKDRRMKAGFVWHCLTPKMNQPRPGHGLSDLERRELLAERGERCEICGSDDPQTSWGWQIDHCHKTGVIRGVLCRPCNQGLGHFEDDVNRMAAAIRYLNLAERNGKAQTVRLADYRGAGY